ncbi:MAG: N-acyl homoserine lactonase family protein [Gemmatimonadaceae bacterium]|nr:N-acyl homoserine lactonase family protein [Gemmatimonadaceae bacterium]
MASVSVMACARALPNGSTPAVGSGQSADAATYTIDAIHFGTLANFPVQSLVAGADTARRIDVALMVWALRAANGHTILVDAGFHRQKFVDRWKPRDYQLPSEAIRKAGIDPDSVRDIVITHIHWDHADGVDLFPNARIWLQREEFEYYVGPRGEALNPAIDSVVAALYRRLYRDGRVQLIDASDVEILPGVRVHTGGKHTVASQFVSVRLAGGETAVVASDNAYLYENLSGKRPIAQTLDSLSNLRAQARMLTLATRPALVIPGHDPALFERFPAPGNGVARIR